MRPGGRLQNPMEVLATYLVNAAACLRKEESCSAAALDLADVTAKAPSRACVKSASSLFGSELCGLAEASELQDIAATLTAAAACLNQLRSEGAVPECVEELSDTWLADVGTGVCSTDTPGDTVPMEGLDKAFHSRTNVAFLLSYFQRFKLSLCVGVDEHGVRVGAYVAEQEDTD